MKNALNIPWDEMTLQDAARIRSALERAQRAHGVHREHMMHALAPRVESGRHLVEKRVKGRPAVFYPEELPVSQARAEIMKHIQEHPVVIVCGDTGSGKTTQLPKMLYELGYGIRGRIGCTQPRRLAAVSMAKRVADELRVSLKGAVGYHVRFDEAFSPQTSIKFMTDGILLAEMPHDRLWLQYEALIIDEAHERSLNIDFILGCLKRLLVKRPELKVVISSATLDAERFSAFFDQAPIVQVEGRRYPVEDFYLPQADADEDMSQQVLRGLDWIGEVDPTGDVLVFLPGEREIHDVADLLRGRRWAHTEVLPLYARLNLSEQQKVFTVGGRRRIVLSTNVAETSLTIPGIRYVVDSGLVRLMRFDPRFQVERLQVEMVSQASANQRRGRCGRVSDGICVRLYSEDMLAESEAFTPPEIQRTSLADVILRMKLSSLPELEDFPFIDPPRTPLIREGYRTLIEIGALDDARQLTRMGRAIGRFQVDPRIARMIIQGYSEDCLDDVLVVTAALSIQDPRERPPDKREEADRAQRGWKDARSDFMTMLNLWKDWRELKEQSASNTKRRRFCRDHFLNMRRMMEWENLWRELSDQVERVEWDQLDVRPGISAVSTGTIAERALTADEERYARLHRSVLSGIPMQIGEKNEASQYRGTRDRFFFLFPGSSLFGNPPAWMMAFELVETTRLFARQVAMCRPEWVEQVAPHVCRAVYTDPYWDGRQGFVYAKKSVMCGGLNLLEGQRIHYGPIAPEQARDVFIAQGLIPADLSIRHPWLRQYRRLLDQVQAMEIKRRRPDSLLNVQGLYEWFDQRLPRDIHNAKDLDRWLQRHAGNIAIQLDDLLRSPVTGDEAKTYPDTLVVEGVHFPLHYTFTPGEPGDGVCVVCPADRIPLLTQAHLDWLIPGWLEDKIYALLRTLTKRIRQQLNPLTATAASMSKSPLKGAFTGYGTDDDDAPDSEVRPLCVVLADYVREQLGEIVGAGDFDESKLPDWMRMSIDVRDAEGRSLIRTNDLEVVRRTVDLKFMAGGVRSESSVAPVNRKADAPVKEKTAPADEADERRTALRWFLKDHQDQVKVIEKRLEISLQSRLFLTSECTCQHPLQDLVHGAVVAVLTDENNGELPKTFEAYQQVAYRARSGVFSKAAEYVQLLDRVIVAWHTVQDRINSATKQNMDSMDEDLALQKRELFYRGFLLYPDYLVDYVRWMRALSIRADRAVYDSRKDQQKQEKLMPHRGILHAWLAHVGSSDRLLPWDLIQALHQWQEWRVSVFAPEVGTRIKVSEKILREMLSAPVYSY